MKPTAAKFTVAQLAKMMGKPPKEVLFLLQGIGVDVKTPESDTQTPQPGAETAEGDSERRRHPRSLGLPVEDQRGGRDDQRLGGTFHRSPIARLLVSLVEGFVQFTVPV